MKYIFLGAIPIIQQGAKPLSPPWKMKYIFLGAIPLKTVLRTAGNERLIGYFLLNKCDRNAKNTEMLTIKYFISASEIIAIFCI
ncbi:MAG: hypothetical protein QG628_490 [Patescibacteria group bacterium]|nr:hypothetical protein [Patescibacteria group bacterium]